ncbi:LacI family transcriptional regulator [Bordetella genomosp. 10]|uniref:LacI family transcriptional regulator n=1 Tax=Bordetella genomosp. 10 TaxID=1416804 RepID=A0A261SII0_9BORD|nr:tripartite tricarboxylate transporter substrate binding protein [Bordetella genomosp. 10]OZI37238.1 LacI family transcriptional regulator [Bordetella genomosp. 10]
MKNARFRIPSWLLAATLALGVLPLSTPARADAYPDKPIRIVVPFPPGGAVDILARLVGQRLGQQMNQSIIVENRSGANGSIGNEYAARSAPDGYTLLLGSNGMATNPFLYPKRAFSELTDLAPIAFLGSSPLIMVVPANSPYKSLKDVVKAAQSDPTKVTYASAGPGSSAHLGSELLKSVTKTGMLHVPYKGGAPAIVDLSAGRVSFMLLDPPQVVPQIKAGRLRPIVVAGRSRLPLLPDVPSATDAGYPDYEAIVWWGFMAPKGVPAGVVARLNKEINTALASDEVKKVLDGMGVVTNPGTPEQFGAFIGAQAKQSSAIIKEAGITAD